MGRHYYPSGGANDMVCTSDDVIGLKPVMISKSLWDYNDFYYDNEKEKEEAKKEAMDYFWECNWAHVYDIVECKIVWSKGD
jgi:hypothetical protein